MTDPSVSVTDLRVSVTDIVRFCHRSGDIDHRLNPSPTGAEGIAGHQRLYAQRPASYVSEYAVESLLHYRGLRLLLRGRADGYDPAAGIVEEIKTCRIAPDKIAAATTALHLAQGKLYAALIARTEHLPGLGVHVTWLNIDTNESHTQSHTFTADELQLFLEATLAQFGNWLTRLVQQRKARNDSLRELAFPYGKFRAGQRDIAELTYKCIDQGGQLLLEAPTGIGKTAAVLFPALKALATGKHDRLVFVTARTTGRRTAEETITRFQAAGYRGNALSLSAKDSICLSPGSACHGDDCPYASGYYDRLPAAMNAALEQPSLERATIEALAHKYHICPYQLAGDLLPWVDTVIADQYYVYGLQAGLGAAIAGGEQRWSILLDEAHNLPPRARDMFSARIAKSALMAAKRRAPDAIARALQRINRRFLSLAKLDWNEPDYHSLKALPDGLVKTLADFSSVVGEHLAQEPALLQRHPPLMDFFFAVLQFLRVAQVWGDEFRLRLRADDGAQSLVLSLECLDPSRLLAQRQASAHAVTAFSATLSPAQWSRDQLGLGDETVCSRATSPFSPDQLRVSIATAPDTRFRQRERTLGELAGVLEHWLEQNPGNCIVYFPSYRYLNDCLAELTTTKAQRTIWVQERDSDEARRAQLLELLGERRDVAAFCILGGIFGEGIDLPGEQLASVAVVGVGMPQVNRETRELQDWHQHKTGNGFEYAFLYPGMQKVDQALGRVIRGPGDRGSALLIDPRYSQPAYRELLPAWWEYQHWES